MTRNDTSINNSAQLQIRHPFPVYLSLLEDIHSIRVEIRNSCFNQTYRHQLGIVLLALLIQVPFIRDFVHMEQIIPG